MIATDELQVFHHPNGARLGLLTAIQNIGGVCALFFCESTKYLFISRTC